MVTLHNMLVSIPDLYYKQDYSVFFCKGTSEIDQDSVKNLNVSPAVSVKILLSVKYLVSASSVHLSTSYETGKQRSAQFFGSCDVR